MPKMTQKRTQRTRRSKSVETANGPRMGSGIPLNAQQEKNMAILKEAERSGRRSMAAAGKRIRRGIREALKASESVG